MSGSPLGESLHPELFTMVLTQTEPGHVWMIRAIVGLLMGGALFWVFGSHGSMASVITGALLATILTASLAWSGHAGAGESHWQSLHLAADVVHLIAAGLWPSGLLPFAILLGRLTKSAEPGLLDMARVATRRFSAMSLVAVGLVVLTGLINSAFLLGSLPALVMTEYGRILMSKLTLFTIACGIGAGNLLVLKPRLKIDQTALATIR
jgi:putative copper resistance protein D